MLAEGHRIGHLLRGGRGLLLDFDADAPLRAVAKRWHTRINTVSSSAENRFGLSAVLVRPDGFVAWAVDSARDYEGFRQAATRWFGYPC